MLVMLPPHASTSVQPVKPPGHASSNGGNAGGGAASGDAGKRPARPSAGGWSGHGNGSANGRENVVQDGGWSGMRRRFRYAIDMPSFALPHQAMALPTSVNGLGQVTIWAARAAWQVAARDTQRAAAAAWAIRG